MVVGTGMVTWRPDQKVQGLESAHVASSLMLLSITCCSISHILSERRSLGPWRANKSLTSRGVRRTDIWLHLKKLSCISNSSLRTTTSHIGRASVRESRHWFCSQMTSKSVPLCFHFFVQCMFLFGFSTALLIVRKHRLKEGGMRASQKMSLVNRVHVNHKEQSKMLTQWGYYTDHYAKISHSLFP